MRTVHLPRLTVVSRPLTAIPDLIEFTDPQEPLVWVRNRRGISGRGVAFRFATEGTARFSSASRVWRELLSLATVDDPVGAPASGPIAFGTFSFAANSAEPSTLIVPRIVVGKKDGAAWVTTITPSGETPLIDLTAIEVLPLERLQPFISGLGDWKSLTFAEPAGEAEAYRQGVTEAVTRLRSGDLDKVVLARRLAAQVPDTADLRVPLTRLSKRYIDCWTFAVDGMVGASPETLIRSIHGTVSARVLAGTRRRDDNEHADRSLATELMASDKERYEHQLAVDSLVDTLTPHVTSLSHDTAPYLLQLPNVWHLATNVRAELADGADAFELAEAVHPTAAVAGTPTPAAIRVIDELEPFDRGRYAGAVGWVGAGGNGDWAIALRSAQIHSGPHHTTITAYAGGGLVDGADPDHEFAETVAKFRPVMEACQ